MPQHLRHFGLFALALIAPAIAHGYTFNNGPVGTGRDNLVVAVHGWNSSPGAWATNMNSAIVNQLTINGRANQWDVWSYDWGTDAVGGTITPNDTALRNAQPRFHHARRHGF